MIWIACENTSDEGWLRRLLRQRGLDAAVGAGGRLQVPNGRAGRVFCRGKTVATRPASPGPAAASALAPRGRGGPEGTEELGAQHGGS